MQPVVFEPSKLFALLNWLLPYLAIGCGIGPVFMKILTKEKLGRCVWLSTLVHSCSTSALFALACALQMLFSQPTVLITFMLICASGVPGTFADWLLLKNVLRVQLSPEWFFVIILWKIMTAVSTAIVLLQMASN